MIIRGILSNGVVVKYNWFMCSLVLKTAVPHVFKRKYVGLYKILLFVIIPNKNVTVI